MFTHDQIWRGIDRLAAHAQTSPSGLARRAGLDSTTFNPSKRISSDGKLRWPSTESLTKALSAAHLGFADFAALVSGESRARSLPALDLADGDRAAAFDAIGLPTGPGWARVPFPDLGESDAYALRVEGEAMLPIYRPGDQLIIAPDEKPRPGDRVMVKTRDGEISGWQLGHSTVQEVALKSLNPSGPDRIIKLVEIAWIARIVWASQ
ncbi:helix-turn-helix transcriptional regulator [uncultured Maricaulis sp.]|uniref:S24 family peptidase n=1 Tax=uncultured Maricaulis sp. TaxID=174710 RepID=UPI0030DD50B8|tara:strand:- start:10148 stop:10771 length:624 start_codon:yes stop_codon:yes gene_type:complete